MPVRGFEKSRIALAVAAALGAGAAAVAPDVVNAAKTPGQYVAGDFHNHTTCSDGSISMQKLVKKATDKVDTPWGLDWFVQAGHGGNGNRNCTLAEDATLATPAYPLSTFAPPVNPNSPPPTLSYPNTTWQNSVPPVQPKGLVSGTAPSQNMWRWQSLQEFQYPLLEYLASYHNKPLFIGVESVVAGHEHSSMSVITGQMPIELDNITLPTTPGYSALGNANALAQWEYCFDRNDQDISRGNTVVGGNVGNNWDCSNTASADSKSADLGWNENAKKLIPPSGAGVGSKGHLKTVEALKWMKQYHPDASYYVPAHLERAGPFNPDGNNGYNIEHLRNFNNGAPSSAFGMETQPGHGASEARGEYTIRRNTIKGTNVDSVGGTTYGGTGVYGAQIGGVWDALLGEGRNFWFFASSDWHNRGAFGPDDRRSTQDFYPGEYQRTYSLVRNGGDSKLRPQKIVDGLRSGNAFSASGQLIDRLAFVACASYPGVAPRSNAAVELLAINAAQNNAAIDYPGCATMGEKLKVRAGADIVVSIVVRDPAGTNYSPYTFENPSLKGAGISRPINQPELHHIDVIGGLVTGYKTPGSADYAGEWPRNWIEPYRIGMTPSLLNVPAGAKNTSASILRTFEQSTWTALSADPQYKAMTFRIAGVSASQYLRLRGTNLPPSTPYETDANGNPLPDLWTNAGAVQATQPNGNDAIPQYANLKIICSPVGSNVPSNDETYTGKAIDGCPNHLPSINGQKYVAYDVAAWSDLWFYSNPVFVEVGGSTVVAGVK